MSELFPMIQPNTEAVESSGTLPLCRECAWDFALGSPIFRRGEPLVVTGVDAVKVWCWKALLTQRARWPIYSWDYGNEVETLVGHNYSEETKRAEAIRYVREALLVSPYVKEVREVAVSFGSGLLTISAAVETIYGEVRVNV